MFPRFSFGTLLFPPSLLQIQTLLDVLIELKIRFQIVRGHAEGDVLEMYEPRLKDSQGRGLMVDWADQYAVLSHEVRLYGPRLSLGQSVTPSSQTERGCGPPRGSE